MSDCRKCAKFEECAVDEDCGLFKPKPQTNADRIRSMSDEELANMMEDNGDCPTRDCPYNAVETYITRKECKMCWLEWLKAEVSE